ncbi:hypothetical protein BC629DRAFT_1598331 [Irpex lacteus]|nr:hypothetical protein BC629DRAFT_1598331 [Irpex lacteus]
MEFATTTPLTIILALVAVFVSFYLQHRTKVDKRDSASGKEPKTEGSSATECSASFIDADTTTSSQLSSPVHPHSSSSNLKASRDRSADGCDVCHREVQTKLQKCSVCKRRYYCTVICQKKDWKEHKFDCSLLPSEPMPLPTIAIPVEVLDAEVIKARELLVRAWSDIETITGSKDVLRREDALRVKAEANKFPSVQSLLAHTLPPSVSLPTQPTSNLNQVRLTRASLSRLFLLHYIAHLRHKHKDDDNAFAESLSLVESTFNEVTTPSWHVRLDGTKITRRPADLSTGEYEAIIQLMMIPMVPNDKEEADKWYDLLVVAKCI